MKISQNNRKIGYTYSSVSGSYAFRGEKSICFESTLERDLVLRLEYDSNVVDVIEQPFTIEYVNKNGRDVTYTPDFLVHYFTPSHVSASFGKKSCLIEVKPKKILTSKWEELKPKFRQGIAYAKENGWVFHIYDESRIRDERLEKLKFLERYKRRDYDPDETNRIIEYLKIVGHIRVDHLIHYLYVRDDDRGIALGHIWHLLSTLVLCCDIELGLNQHSVVWLNTEKINPTGEFYE